MSLWLTNHAPVTLASFQKLAKCFSLQALEFFSLSPEARLPSRGCCLLTFRSGPREQLLRESTPHSFAVYILPQSHCFLSKYFVHFLLSTSHILQRTNSGGVLFLPICFLSLLRPHSMRSRNLSAFITCDLALWAHSTSPMTSSFD